MTPDGTTIIETRDLEIGYSENGRRLSVMKNLNLRARHGDLVALIGRNGSGKSTLLRTLVMLQAPMSGTIEIDNLHSETIDRDEIPKLISYASTEPIAVHNLSVKEAVSLGRFPYTNWLGTLTDDDIISVNEALTVTGLMALETRKIDTLSDGERQRVLIARSLAQDTDLLVMDEPTAFLDLPSRFGIVNLLRRLTREKNKCVIYSTHDLDTAISEADMIWLMTDEGISQGAPEDHILSGRLARAFESPMLSFNDTTGLFSFTRNRAGEISLLGTGLSARLTEKALLRCGYGINSSSETLVKVISSGEKTEWLMTFRDETLIFDSVYDLVSHLPSEPEE